MLSPRADENAALVFDDLASALDAGLPIEALGADPGRGDDVLTHLVERRGVKLGPTESIVLQSGWRSGRGSDALRSRAEHRRRRAVFGHALWQGLRYPLLLLVMLPLAAVATSYVIGPQVAIAIGCVYAVLALFVLWLAYKLGRGDAVLDRIPFLAPLLADVREMPYLETLHALYGAGVSIVEAHERAVAAVRMQGLKQRLQIAQNKLRAGQPLREALAEAAALEPETRSLLATGEQAGQLEDALLRAIGRRQDVAARKLTQAARRVGQVAYVLAVVGIVVVVFRFYSSYYALLSGR